MNASLVQRKLAKPVIVCLILCSAVSGQAQDLRPEITAGIMATNNYMLATHSGYGANLYFKAPVFEIKRFKALIGFEYEYATCQYSYRYINECGDYNTFPLYSGKISTHSILIPVTLRYSNKKNYFLDIGISYKFILSESSKETSNINGIMVDLANVQYPGYANTTAPYIKPLFLNIGAGKCITCLHRDCVLGLYYSRNLPTILPGKQDLEYNQIGFNTRNLCMAFGMKL